jgi:hypothetical protein
MDLQAVALGEADGIGSGDFVGRGHMRWMWLSEI